MNRFRLERCLHFNLTTFGYFFSDNWRTNMAAVYCHRAGYRLFTDIEQVAGHFEIPVKDAKWLFLGYGCRDEGIVRLKEYLKPKPVKRGRRIRNGI